jgi:hypothetical protein
MSRKIIKKILKEEFDSLNWADELSGAENGWDLISEITNTYSDTESDDNPIDSRIDFIKSEYDLKIKVKDLDYLNSSLISCGMTNLSSIDDLELQTYNLIKVGKLKRSFVDCDANRIYNFGYPNNTVDAVLLSNIKIFGRDEEFWFIPEWADLIFIPKK